MVVLGGVLVEPLALGLNMLVELVSPYSTVTAPRALHQLASKDCHGDPAWSSGVTLKMWDMAARTPLVSAGEVPSNAH